MQDQTERLDTELALSKNFAEAIAERDAIITDLRMRLADSTSEAAVLAAARAFRDAMDDFGYADKTIGLGNALLIAAHGMTR